MRVSDLLKFIPDEELEFLSSETKVDYQVKKLSGVNVFKLILYAMLHNNNPSLRVMEGYYGSVKFRMLAETGDSTVKFNSIRDRICNINPEFFERIFNTVFDRFSEHFQEKQALLRFDSTMVAVSSKLIEWGMRVGNHTDKNQIKFTVGMKGSFPCHVSIFGTQKELSEDKTIPEAILNYDQSENSVVVFDRGVQKRKTFELFSAKDIHFVTRVKTPVRYRLQSSDKLPAKPADSSITVHADNWVQLSNNKNRYTKQAFRLIEANIDKTGEAISFLSNIEDLTAYEIAAIYKMRWEIEVLFKFLKQELNLNHLVSRNLNGMRVMIHMTLILAILVIAYKKLNKMPGYKIAKLKFAIELESSLIRQIVILSGGDPNKVSHLFNDE